MSPERCGADGLGWSRSNAMLLAMEIRHEDPKTRVDASHGREAACEIT
jgi:hypothetical protein